VIISLVAAFAAVFSVGASPATAQPPLEQARARFEQGEAYFKAGTYDKAIEEYRAAYALAPRPALLFNIGLCYEQLDDDANAIDHYDRYLAADPAGAKTTEARARREALTRKLDAKRTAADVTRRATDERTAGLRAADAGDHDEAIKRLTASYALLPEPEVVFELAEAYRGKGDDVLAATEYRRYLSTSASGAHRERASERLREIETRSVGTGPEAPVPTRRGSLKPAIVAYSVAGVAAVVGIVYGLKARDTLGTIDDELTTGTPPLDTGDPRFADGRLAARNADIAFAIAGAAAITGAVLTWRALRTRRPIRPGEAVVVPTTNATSAGVRIEVVW
jgi:tetratricopeptide (TPR) repeat protein